MAEGILKGWHNSKLEPAISPELLEAQQRRQQQLIKNFIERRKGKFVLNLIISFAIYGHSNFTEN